MTTRTTLSRTALPVALVAAVLVGAGCEINSPEMPSFDTTFTLPIGVETLTVLEAVEDEDFLVVGEDGTLGFSVDGDADTLALDFALAVDLPTESVAQGLGDFTLPAGDPVAFAFTLGEVWPPAAAVDGVTTLVPAFPFDLTSGGEDLPDIESAVLASGALSVTVSNGFAVPLGADSGADQIVLELRDPAGGAPLATLAFPRLAPGEQATRAADLAGVVLPDAVAVRITGGSPGSGAAPVTVRAADTIAVDAAFTDLVVSSATAVVAAQSFSTSFAVDLPADYEISRAVIDQGRIDLDLANDMPLPCTVTVIWDQVRDLDGVPLVRAWDLAPGTAITPALDLAGYLVVADGAALTGLDLQVAVSSPGSGGAPVALSAADGVTAAVDGGTVTFASVTGLVPATVVALDPVTETIDLPDEMDGLELTAARLELTLTNSAGIAADVDLTLTGTAADGAVRTLDVAEHVLPALDRNPAVTTIVLDETNSGVLDFLNNLPETITLGGDVIAGGGGVAGTVRPDEYAVVQWTLSAPVEVVITGATLDSDPRALDLDADLRDRIATHARGAELHAEILNHLPMGVELRIVAHTDTSLLDSAPLLVIGPVAVAAAETDPVSHAVSAAVTSRPVVALDTDQARIFGLAGLHTRVEAFLPATDGQPVRVMSSDYLEFRGVVQLEVLIDDEF
ncbi:hypothetical protein KDM41_13885 [bacterium]|nr:hypothetical protein [bacterium]